MFKIPATGKLWTRSHFDTEFVVGFESHSVCPFGFWNGVFALSFFCLFVPRVYLQNLPQLCDFLLLSALPVFLALA